MTIDNEHHLLLIAALGNRFGRAAEICTKIAAIAEHRAFELKCLPGVADLEDSIGPGYDPHVKGFADGVKELLNELDKAEKIFMSIPESVRFKMLGHSPISNLTEENKAIMKELLEIGQK